MQAFERNGWREVKLRYSIRHFVSPDGSEPSAHLTPVVEILVPTRYEIIGLANKRHEAKAVASIEVDCLQVFYSPSSSYRTTNRVGQKFTRRHAESFMMFKTCWLVKASWERGNDKPPEWSFTGDGDSAIPEPALRLVVERERVER